MLVSCKIDVLITKKYFRMFPYTYLIVYLGQFQILGETSNYLFSKHFVWPLHTIYMAKRRISEFSAKKYFLPTTDRGAKFECDFLVHNNVYVPPKTRCFHI